MDQAEKQVRLAYALRVAVDTINRLCRNYVSRDMRLEFKRQLIMRLGVWNPAE